MWVLNFTVYQSTQLGISWLHYSSWLSVHSASWCFVLETNVHLHCLMLFNSGKRINPGGGGGGGVGGGGTLIFLYTRRLGSFYWVQNFEFQYFLGFSEK